MKKILAPKEIWLLLLFSLGIILRYVVMSLGWNYDFESFRIVGEIAGNFRNVYAETSRYNYGPIFFCIQGLLYKISLIKPEHQVLIFRVLIVSVLIFADLGISAFIANKYSWKKALIFFLNPISIIITGYHNQFDNIAVLLALLSINFFNEDEKFNKKDLGFIALFSLSLITKHILFILPVFILLMKNLPAKKKFLYAFVPPMIFLLSFVPFAFSSSEAAQGILENVFRYRSTNHAPLLIILYRLVHFPKEPRLIVYIIMMIFTALLTRKYKFDKILLVYLIAMVSFSSGMANQYLIIPMAGLCVLDVGIWNKIYMAAMGLYLLLQETALGFFLEIQKFLPLPPSSDNYNSIIFPGGTIIAAWILFFALIHVIKNNKGN